MFVHLKGRLLDFKDGCAVKRHKFYVDDTIEKYLDIPSVGGHVERTDRSGRFNCEVFLNKSRAAFWIIAPGYAQVRCSNWDTMRTSWGEELNIGDVYLIPYDNELQQQEYNVPRKKSKTIEPSKRYSISQLLGLFSKDSVIRRLHLSRIDTTTGLISRLNFGPGKPRGTVIQSYKTVLFELNLQK